MPKFEIDINKTYNFPKEICTVHYKNKIIIIAPDLACWIVFDTPDQLNIFNLFKQGKSISDVLTSESFNKIDVNHVVTQIEARHFYNKQVFSSTLVDRSLHLYLTNKCNLTCPHCYMFSGEATENELTTEEVVRLIKDYHSIANGKSITISGGEPTLRIDFDEIVREAYLLGLEVKILSNGTLLTTDRLNNIAKYISSAQISIDGYNEESNSLIRGKGHFEMALKAVDLLIKNNIDTSIAITPPYNLLRNKQQDYINFAKALLEQYKGQRFQIKFSDELLNGRSIQSPKRLRAAYRSSMIELQRKVYGDNHDILSFVESLRQNRILDSCMFGVFSVASNGDVYFCARIGDLKPVANIRTSSFKDIYHKGILAERAAIVTNLRPCKDCDLRYICGGGCRIDEFPDLVNRDSFENIDFDKISQRECDSKVKDKFYDMLIRSNKYFYTAIENN